MTLTINQRGGNYREEFEDFRNCVPSIGEYIRSMSSTFKVIEVVHYLHDDEIELIVELLSP